MSDINNIDNAKDLLKEICKQNFNDKTFIEYIDKKLAGDFATEISNYIESLRTRIAELTNGEAQIEHNKDTDRIDFLQSKTKGYGNGWIFSDSSTGRGMRLHETTKDGAKPTVREAIDASRLT